jgi:hypothetical protein
MELKQITLPSGAIAHMKPELTSGDYDDIQSVYLDASEREVDPTTQEVKLVQKMTTSQIHFKAKYRLIEVLVKKIEYPAKEGEEVRVISPVTETDAREMSASDVNFLKTETEAIKALATLSVEDRKN